MKQSLTKEEKESERFKAVVFSFCVLIVGTYGLLIDSYDDGEPIIPNLINLIFNREIIPDEQNMFSDEFYIENQSMSPINVNGVNTVAYSIKHQKDNKVNGMFFYMILCFLPLFIIAFLDINVDEFKKKINENRIKRKK